MGHWYSTERIGVLTGNQLQVDPECIGYRAGSARGYLCNQHNLGCKCHVQVIIIVRQKRRQWRPDSRTATMVQEEGFCICCWFNGHGLIRLYYSRALSCLNDQNAAHLMAIGHCCTGLCTISPQPGGTAISFDIFDFIETTLECWQIPSSLSEQWVGGGSIYSRTDTLQVVKWVEGSVSCIIAIGFNHMGERSSAIFTIISFRKTP